MSENSNPNREVRIHETAARQFSQEAAYYRSEAEKAKNENNQIAAVRNEIEAQRNDREAAYHRSEAEKAKNS